MTVECPWCGEEYEDQHEWLSPADCEERHLQGCRVFQTLPVAETTADGKTFVRFQDTDILVERARVN